MKQKTLSSLLFLILGYTIGCQAEPAPEIASSKAAPAALQNADQLYTPHDFRQITSMTSKILDRNHYSELVMSRELSARIFDRFFDSLDPQHTFFTQQDMAKFTAKRETLGWDLQKGEYQLAFDVYDVYKKRYAEYRAFTEKMLKSEIDFTVDEFLLIDLSKEPRPADDKALHELWRKQIKSDLLNFRLSERAAREEHAKNPKAQPPAPRDPVKSILQRQRDVGNAINKRDKIDILGLLLDAMANSYGAHCDYQAPKLSEDFDIHMSLSLCGIGATLTSENGYIKVVDLVPKGPAEKSGKVKINDRIVSVTQENGETVDLVDMPVSKAVQYIRGEKGTKVTLSILSGNSSAPTQVTIVRDVVKLEADAAKGKIEIVDGVKVGIITLPSFYMDFDAVMRGDKNARKASTDVERILKKFNAEGVQSVVIDLRNNGGGSLPDAIALSGLFLNGGTVVQVRYSGVTRKEQDPSKDVVYSGPLVILTNKFSASAAEIFTGALSDAKRAVVVGDSRTFGKGTVLRVQSLDEYRSWFGKKVPTGSLTYEIAMFFRPGGSSVQQLGITPDIILPSLTDEMKVGEIYLNNHLPWNSIAPAEFKIWDPGLDKKIVALRKNSQLRRKNDPLYQAYIRQIELYRNIRERSQLSLNENTRYAEYLKEKEVTDEADKIFTEAAEKDSSKDIILQEAMHVAADLTKL